MAGKDKNKTAGKENPVASEREENTEIEGDDTSTRIDVFSFSPKKEDKLEREKTLSSSSGEEKNLLNVLEPC